MSEQAPAIATDPEIMSGTPVFVGTRVPFQTLLDYLEAGQPLSEFLEDFPTVSREQAIAAAPRRPRIRRLPQPLTGAFSTNNSSRCSESP